MRVLRVGLDGRAFVSPAAGVRRYVTELTRGLLALDAPLELAALGGPPADRLPAGLDRVPEPLHPPTNLGWTLAGVPRAARRGRVDLIHAPAYTAPLRAAVPVVVTIHDVSYERHPEWYPYRRDRGRRWFYRLSARSAAHIVTDSAFSRSEIAAAYGVPLERISVIPLGVDTEVFAPPAVPQRPPEPAGERPYLLHVGDLHARRNLAVVVGALAVLGRRGAPGRLVASLVLAGVDRGAGADLQAMANAAGFPESVVRLGPVGPERLVSLYQGAAALVYPSRYEGFGLPLLEAMACGTPVIAANRASIPEVVGAAGLLLDPDEPKTWADAIDAVINDPDRRQRLKAAGIVRAERFPWTATAAATLDVYRRVAPDKARG